MPMDSSSLQDRVQACWVTGTTSSGAGPLPARSLTPALGHQPVKNLGLATAGVWVDDDEPTTALSAGRSTQNRPGLLTHRAAAPRAPPGLPVRRDTDATGSVQARDSSATSAASIGRKSNRSVVSVAGQDAPSSAIDIPFPISGSRRRGSHVSGKRMLGRSSVGAQRRREATSPHSPSQLVFATAVPWSPSFGLVPDGQQAARGSPRFPGDPSRAFASFQDPGRIGDALPHYGLADAAPAPFKAKTSA